MSRAWLKAEHTFIANRQGVRQLAGGKVASSFRLSLSQTRLVGFLVQTNIYSKIKWSILV